jgi:oligoendopeptidase F
VVNTPKTGAETVRWDLSDLYTGIEDPKIEQDLQGLISLAKAFHSTHHGNLARTLGQALKDQAEMHKGIDKLMVYLFLQRSTDALNARIQQRIANVQEAWSEVAADCLNFFEHEVVAIDEATYSKLLKDDDEVATHRPMLDQLRRNKKYLLEENVERALTLRSPFGASEWSDYTDELEAELRFRMGEQELRLPEILHIISNAPETERRADALASFSQGLSEQRFDRFMARTLNVVLGAKGVEDRERGYASPMAARNIGNQVEDDTVQALHAAVADVGAAQCRRYYRLLSAHLKIAPLKWSDRNAPLPFADNRVIAWEQCIETVLSAYSSFSPTLANLVRRMLDNKWVDAPPYEGKVGGAFNYSVLLPGSEARAYNFLNYLGSTRDVMTVAHELGHGVHGLLAAEAQGALMFRAPMAYAETASIFGEMTTFQYLLRQAETDEQRLALLMSKASDHINSVVRQISFSNFEQSIHQRRRQGNLTVAEYNDVWMEVTRAFYGNEGDIFTYAHTNNLWAYVTHFLRPFYVYAYAFGELFTQSLFALKDSFGDRFEPMYLDLLRAGGSQSAVELMAPFGLDPREPSFWTNGITASLKEWLDEAEEISARLGVTPAAS